MPKILEGMFDKKSWDDLNPGDLIFYSISSVGDYAYGPFEVIDPSIGRMGKPGTDMRMDDKKIQPLVLNDRYRMQAKRVDATPETSEKFPFPLLKNGEYGKQIDGTWYCRAPKESDEFGHIGNLSAHQITEHEDGTITVSPSILIKRHDSQWHGYLERGVWREC